MLKSQEKIIEYVKGVKSELDKVQLAIDNLDEFAETVRRAELVVPVVGEFSAGKSSLLNAFLGKDYLPVGIRPETSLATELRFSKDERIIAVAADGSEVKYAVNEIEKIKERAGEYSYLRMYLDNERLRSIEPLILVDMPGFNSPLDLHNKAIMAYLNKGAHYIVLTSVESGTITRSMTRQLEDIREYQRDFSFFLSKANLRSVSESEQIASQLKEAVRTSLGLDKDVVPINQNGGESLERIMKELDPDSLVYSLFMPSLKQYAYSIDATLNTKITALSKDTSQNDAALEELKKSREKLLQKRERMLNEVTDKYSSQAVDSLVDSVGRDLSSSLDEFVTAAVNGGQEALSTAITEVVRHSLVSNVKTSMTDIGERIEKDFRIEMRDMDAILKDYTADPAWIEKVSGVSANFLKGVSGTLTNVVADRNGKGDLGDLYKTITSILSILTKVLNPVLELVIVFLPEILNLIFGNVTKQAQMNKIRESIVSAIPSIKRNLREKIPSILEENIKAMIAEIGSRYDAMIAEKESEIAAIEAQKASTKLGIDTLIDALKAAKENISIISNFIYE